MKSKEITIIGLSVASTIVLGLMVYPLFPAPLIKLVLLAPFLGLTVAVPLLFYKRPIMLIYVTVCLGAILMFFSLFMGAAILAAGFMSYLFTKFVLRGCDTPRKIVAAAASFPSLGFVSAFGIIYYLLEIPLVQTLSLGLAILLFILTTILAALGAHASVILFSRHTRRSAL